MNTPSRLAAILVFALIAVRPIGAQPPKPLDFEVKATYLLNFGRFATWPSGAPANGRDGFAVCVIGRDPFGSALDKTVAGESIDGKAVVVRRITDAQAAGDCRILFVSASEEARLPIILPAAAKAAVLTVSDIPRFTDRGGMIEFVPQDRKVRFRVNAASVEQAGLTLSSELLRVATAVIRSAP
jgi:hypothetical protein